MTDIEVKRKQLDRFIIEKEFNLSNSEVISKALELENYMTKKSQAI